VRQKKKPDKKNDAELWKLIPEKISSLDYLFVDHAKDRLKTRKILDIEVLDILENKAGRNRKRNKSKDIYNPDRSDWNYCIEGFGLDHEKIRIIISFDESLLLVITAIRLNNSE
jgi:hypothetical protein